MADPLRDQDTSAADSPGRESRIEELLLAGLDHYFSGQHELAISVWTRVLFLDRSHARARAYIERARGAIAERQREGEELLQTGAAAFSRGDTEDARRLLTSAVERGVRPEEALAMLERLERLAPADVDGVATPIAASEIGPGIRRYTRGLASRSPGSGRARRGFDFGDSAGTLTAGGFSGATLLLVLAIGLTAGVLVMIARSSGVWPWRLSLSQAAAAQAPIRVVPDPLPVPSASEVSLARARAWSATGRLRDALTALEAIRPGDPLRAQADDLRARIQQQLLDSARATQTPPSPK
jgi:tetratricopeptide (TPR) repeat protein